MGEQKQTNENLEQESEIQQEYQPVPREEIIDNKKFKFSKKKIIYNLVTIFILFFLQNDFFISLLLTVIYLIILWLYHKLERKKFIVILTVFFLLLLLTPFRIISYIFLSLGAFYFAIPWLSKKIDNKTIIKTEDISRKERIRYLLSFVVFIIFLFFIVVISNLSMAGVLIMLNPFSGAILLLDLGILFFIIFLFVTILRKEYRQKNIYSGEIISLYFTTILLIAFNILPISIFFGFLSPGDSLSLILMFMIIPLVLPTYSLYFSIKTVGKVKEYTNIYRTAMMFAYSLSIVHFIFVLGHRLINIFMLLK